MHTTVVSREPINTFLTDWRKFGVGFQISHHYFIYRAILMINRTIYKEIELAVNAGRSPLSRGLGKWGNPLSRYYLSIKYKFAQCP